MGEYWKPVNFTKREFLHPHRLNCGLKLGEWHGYDSAVELRIRALIESGQWSADDDICACSDYDGLHQLHGKAGERPEFEGYDVEAIGFADVSLPPGEKQGRTFGGGDEWP